MQKLEIKFITNLAFYSPVVLKLHKSSVFKADVSSLPCYWRHPLQKGRIIKKRVERIIGRHKTFISFTTLVIYMGKQLVYLEKST